MQMQHDSAELTPAPASAAPVRRAVAVVLNGAAGALVDRGDQGDSLREQFAAAGLDAQFIPQDAGTLPERVRLARRSGAWAVVAAGGDGTIACTAQELAGTDIPMAILPFGTMNLLARDLGLPIGDTAAAIRMVAEGAVRRIDVGEVNGQVFLCASMLGLPARLARYRESERGRSTLHLWTRMARAAIRALARGGHRLRVAVRLEQEMLRLRTTSLTITVNPLEDGTGRTFGRLSLDGGELAVYDIGRLGVGGLLRLALRLLTGHWHRDALVHVRRTRRLAVASGRTALRVMNDGEVRLLRPPLRYRVRPRALLVVTPPPTAPASGA
jgi:diacylglycerol kinase family enzyme